MIKYVFVSIAILAIETFAKGVKYLSSVEALYFLGYNSFFDFFNKRSS